MKALFVAAFMVIAAGLIAQTTKAVPVAPTLVYVSYKIKTGWGIVDVGMVPVKTTALSVNAKPDQMLNDLMVVLRTSGRLDNVDLTNPARASVTIIGWQTPRDGVRMYSTDSTEVMLIRMPLTPVPDHPNDKQ